MLEVNGHGDIELGGNLYGVLHVTSRHEFTPGIVNVSGEVSVTPDEFLIVVLDMEALADQAQSLEQPRLFGQVFTEQSEASECFMKHPRAPLFPQSDVDINMKKRFPVC